MNAKFKSAFIARSFVAMILTATSKINVEIMLKSNRQGWRCFHSITLFTVLLSVIAAAGEVAASAKQDFDVIPTPKQMQFHNRRMLLLKPDQTAAVIGLYGQNSHANAAVDIINRQVAALGAEAFETVRLESNHTIQPDSPPLILLTPSMEDLPVKIRNRLLPFYREISPLGAQAYTIQFLIESDVLRIVCLAGAGPEGLLYAAVTFSKMLRRQGDHIVAQAISIVDWPDFQYRALPVWPMPRSFDAFKRAIDWAVAYKFNRIFTRPSRNGRFDKFSLPTPTERQYLRLANEYAAERGMKITYMLSWAVGSRAENGKDPKFKDALLFNGLYYTWSIDELLKARAGEIGRFVRETETTSLNLHCIDTYEENWSKRKAPDRSRFGDDRAAADANVINLLTRELRRHDPDMELQFVVYPYQINFSLPGNSHYRRWMSKLSRSIPKDVHLCVTEHNRDQTESWADLVRQPLVHWINGNAFQWGRYFTTSPSFTKSCYLPDRPSDMIYNAEPIGFFQGEVMQAVAAEYAWNVTAPGSRLVRENHDGETMVAGAFKYFRKREVNGTAFNTWSWYRATEDPEDTIDSVLVRACELEYGSTAGQSMTAFYRNNPLGWRGPDLIYRCLNRLGHRDRIKAIEHQIELADRAVAALQKANRSGCPESASKRDISRLLKTTQTQKMFLTGALYRFRSVDALFNGDHENAEKAAGVGLNYLDAYINPVKSDKVWKRKENAWKESSTQRLKTILLGIQLKKNGAKNLITNPGFEQPAGSSAPHSSWVFKNSGAEPTLDRRSGRYASVFTLKPAAHFASMSHPISISPDIAYYLEFWIKKENRARMVPLMVYKDNRGRRILQKIISNDLKPIDVVEEFELISTVLRVPESAAAAEFSIRMDWFGTSPTKTIDLMVDDVFFAAIPAALLSRYTDNPLSIASEN